MPGTLYLVATPIGNLKDITFRAIEVLKLADVIACEDTRHTRKLMNHYQISNKLVSYHQHNERERAEELGALLVSGKNVAVVSDAGTPGISDPGFPLVQTAIEIGASVIPIPGPAAFVNAAIVSGLSTDSLFYGGFLPSKKSERQKRLRELAGVPTTLVFYETPHRISKALLDCRDVLGPRQAAVARELTKLHEEIVRGTLDELISHFSATPARGEIVLVIDRPGETAVPPERGLSLPDRVQQLVTEGVDRKAALKAAAKEFGMSRSEAYRVIQDQKNP
jgi:16S rRNA (cytidine1402-2'-O)-methyltransferase